MKEQNDLFKKLQSCNKYNSKRCHGKTHVIFTYKQIQIILLMTVHN